MASPLITSMEFLETIYESKNNMLCISNDRIYVYDSGLSYATHRISLNKLSLNNVEGMYERAWKIIESQELFKKGNDFTLNNFKDNWPVNHIEKRSYVEINENDSSLVPTKKVKIHEEDTTIDLTFLFDNANNLVENTQETNEISTSDNRTTRREAKNETCADNDFDNKYVEDLKTFIPGCFNKDKYEELSKMYLQSLFWGIVEGLMYGNKASIFKSVPFWPTGISCYDWLSNILYSGEQGNYENGIRNILSWQVMYKNREIYNDQSIRIFRIIQNDPVTIHLKGLIRPLESTSDSREVMLIAYFINCAHSINAEMNFRCTDSDLKFFLKSKIIKECFTKLIDFQFGKERFINGLWQITGQKTDLQLLQQFDSVESAMTYLIVNESVYDIPVVFQKGTKYIKLVLDEHKNVVARSTNFNCFVNQKFVNDGTFVRSLMKEFGDKEAIPLDLINILAKESCQTIQHVYLKLCNINEHVKLLHRLLSDSNSAFTQNLGKYKDKDEVKIDLMQIYIKDFISKIIEIERDVLYLIDNEFYALREDLADIVCKTNKLLEVNNVLLTNNIPCVFDMMSNENEFKLLSSVKKELINYMLSVQMIRQRKELGEDFFSYIYNLGCSGESKCISVVKPGNPEDFIKSILSIKSNNTYKILNNENKLVIANTGEKSIYEFDTNTKQLTKNQADSEMYEKRNIEKMFNSNIFKTTPNFLKLELIDQIVKNDLRDIKFIELLDFYFYTNNENRLIITPDISITNEGLLTMVMFSTVACNHFMDILNNNIFSGKKLHTDSLFTFFNKSVNTKVFTVIKNHCDDYMDIIFILEKQNNTPSMLILNTKEQESLPTVIQKNKVEKVIFDILIESFLNHGDLHLSLVETGDGMRKSCINYSNTNDFYPQCTVMFGLEKNLFGNILESFLEVIDKLKQALNNILNSHIDHDIPLLIETLIGLGRGEKILNLIFSDKLDDIRKLDTLAINKNSVLLKDTLIILSNN